MLCNINRELWEKLFACESALCVQKYVLKKQKSENSESQVSCCAYQKIKETLISSW